MKSLQYTLKGEIEEIKDKYHGIPIFRKYVDINRSKNELEIAKKLLQHPCPHCVHIYTIYEGGRNTYIDMEILDTKRDLQSEKEKIYTDIRMGLEELHLHHVVYIDLKDDNIGFSEKDQVWKIFDFDASGISDAYFEKWLIEPPHYYAYKKVIKQCYQIDDSIVYFPVEKYVISNLLLFDKIIYDDFIQELNAMG